MTQMGEPEYWQQVVSPWGPLWLAASARGITRLIMGQQVGAGQLPAASAAKHLQQLRDQLTQYFAGEPIQFTVPLAPAGTAFQQEVWAALQRIPHGQTRSYGELAQAVARPRAYQAVGQANGANPIPIVIPCHRVIQADGRLGGYSGGLAIKEKLLALEQGSVKKV